jgi:hypothetical protein
MPGKPGRLPIIVPLLLVTLRRLASEVIHVFIIVLVVTIPVQPPPSLTSDAVLGDMGSHLLRGLFMEPPQDLVRGDALGGENCNSFPPAVFGCFEDVAVPCAIVAELRDEANRALGDSQEVLAVA